VVPFWTVAENCWVRLRSTVALSGETVTLSAAGVGDDEPPPPPPQEIAVPTNANATARRSALLRFIGLIRKLLPEILFASY
jgi:hypothetical protein